MPFLDPSVVLWDPQFADTIQVTQRIQNVDVNGIVTTSNNTYQRILAVVSPTNPADLKRLPEMQYGQRTLTVFCKFHLNGPSTNPVTGQQRQPDLVLWRNDTFIVKILLPWTQYGPGWVKAIVTSIDAVEALT